MADTLQSTADPTAAPPLLQSDRVSAVFYPLASFAALLLLWQFGVRAAGIPEYILPVPSEFLAKLWAERALITEHTLVTAKEIVLGFLMAAAVSIPLGFFVVSVRPIERAVYPVIVFFQLVPKIAIAPLFV
ncbi:MAG TPA: ABC transporter permease, partial [Casimicrobiaceae bacterium]|nr:ABC transporter permease [Casimicrobiaceae bacterium]